MKKYFLALLIILLAGLNGFATDGGGQYYRIGTYWDTTNNVVYEGIKAYHYTTGTTNNLACWENENKTTACPSPALDDGGTCDSVANDGMIDNMYCDGVYDLVICTSTDTDCPTTPLYTHTAIRITPPSRAFMMTDDHGTSTPSASATNRWQMFVKHDASNNFVDLMVNNGSSFVTVLPSTTAELTVLTTFGDILYRNATVPARLAAGTSGQVLQTNGNAAAPSWVTLASTEIALRDQVRNLVMTTTGNNTATVTADELTLQDASGVPARIATVSETLDMANLWTANSSTTDGRGIGISDSANTWYYIWIVNGTTGTSIVATTESTLAGALADVGTGYNTYGALVGELRNNVSANFESIKKVGNRSIYRVMTVNQRATTTAITVGDPAVPTWVAVPVRATSTDSVLPLPPSAKILKGYLYSETNSTQVIAAPNNTYGAVSQATNPPPIQGNQRFTASIDWLLESDYIYWAVTIGAAPFVSINVLGWED